MIDPGKKLSEVTSLKAGVNIAYNGYPPRDILLTDASVKVGIVVNFYDK